METVAITAKPGLRATIVVASDNDATFEILPWPLDGSPLDLAEQTRLRKAFLCSLVCAALDNPKPLASASQLYDLWEISALNHLHKLSATLRISKSVLNTLRSNWCTLMWLS